MRVDLKIPSRPGSLSGHRERCVVQQIGPYGVRRAGGKADGGGDCRVRRVGGDQDPGPIGIEHHDVQTRNGRRRHDQSRARPQRFNQSAVYAELTRDVPRRHDPRFERAIGILKTCARARSGVKRDHARAMRDRAPGHRRQRRCVLRCDHKVHAIVAAQYGFSRCRPGSVRDEHLQSDARRHRLQRVERRGLRRGPGDAVESNRANDRELILPRRSRGRAAIPDSDRRTG